MVWRLTTLHLRALRVTYLLPSAGIRTCLCVTMAVIIVMILVGNLKERYNLRDAVVNGKIILKQNLISKV